MGGARAEGVIVRFERRADAEAIRAVTEAAFAGAEHSDGTEADIPERLREAGALRLSLVAEWDGEVVGHAAFSPAHVGGDSGWVALGPVAVRPDRQREGIGARLIEAGLAQLRGGAPGCVVLGDPGYYGRFGFRPAAGLRWGEVTAPHLQVLVWSGGAPEGEVEFHPVFAAAPEREGPEREGPEREGPKHAGPGPLDCGCGCGAVRVRIARAPERALACPCDRCRRIGACWAEVFASDLVIEGSSEVHRRGRAEFHRCRVCGVVTHRVDLNPGGIAVAVNLAGLAPSVLPGLPVVAAPIAGDLEG